ncbi:MAG: NADP-dependent oxidoreductase [Gemmatimonadetes bacterium]|nr:NADP-dependent oxidoreductase [Gemmatimonadota bacterium]
MSEHRSREVRLKTRPVGLPKESDFEFAEVTVGSPTENEVLIKNIYMSVDPYMRGRMMDRKSYTPPFEVGAVLQGGAVGQVVESRADGFQEGDHVLSMNGWREYFLSSGDTLRKVDGSLAPLSAYLGVLGMPGLTAYLGLADIGKPEPGQTVFVSGAAGAVGSAACQIAKEKGCRVVGSAGSQEKVDWLQDEAGVDVALNYKTVEDLRAALLEACPDGIDVYFDNVGGDHLEAALWGMNNYGRIIACGSISTYNATEPQPGPPNLFQMIGKRLMWKGFIVSDHLDRFPAFAQEMGSWIAEGKVVWRETVHEGIENAPQAFIGLFSGGNMGKMLVRLAADA